MTYPILTGPTQPGKIGSGDFGCRNGIFTPALMDDGAGDGDLQEFQDWAISLGVRFGQKQVARLL